jgi:malonyl-CoA O-methyltransferase
MDQLNYKSIISNNFGQSANTYDQSAVLQQTVALSLIERLKLLNITPQNILDLGSGTGYLSQQLKFLYPTATIIQLDIATKMISFTKKNKSFENTHFVCGDAEKLPFPESCFDLIISNFVFHWFLEPQNVLVQIHRALKSSGIWLFSTLGPDTLKELKMAFATIDSASHTNHFLDMHDIGDLLAATHFQNPVIDMEMLTLTYSSLEKLHQDLKLTGSYTVLRDRPLGLKTQRFREKLFSAYEVYRDHQQLLPASFEIIYGQAFGSKQKKLHCADKNGVVRIPIEDIF